MTVFVEAAGVGVAELPVIPPQALSRNPNNRIMVIERLIFFMIFLLTT